MKRNNQKGSYDPRYYTMDRLGEISLSNVNINLKQFMKDYDVTDYPVDCFMLVRKIQETALIHLQVLEEGRMSPAFNAVAAYFPEVDSYQIVMKPVPADWKDRSSWRRCNFTLAHELGHIFCGHLSIPKDMKTADRRAQDDLEADEFILGFAFRRIFHGNREIHQVDRRIGGNYQIDLFQSGFTAIRQSPMKSSIYRDMVIICSDLQKRKIHAEY